MWWSNLTTKSRENSLLLSLSLHISTVHKNEHSIYLESIFGSYWFMLWGIKSKCGTSVVHFKQSINSHFPPSLGRQYTVHYRLRISNVLHVCATSGLTDLSCWYYAHSNNRNNNISSAGNNYWNGISTKVSVKLFVDIIFILDCGKRVF